MRLAASRTFCTAGKRRPIRMAMMAMTTSSSISVKALAAGQRVLGRIVGIVHTPSSHLGLDRRETKKKLITLVDSEPQGGKSQFVAAQLQFCDTADWTRTCRTARLDGGERALRFGCYDRRSGADNAKNPPRGAAHRDLA